MAENESQSAVTVVVRVRPPSQEEVAYVTNTGRVFQGTIKIDGTDSIEASLPKVDVLSPSFAKGSDTVFQCHFSKVLKPGATQAQVFEIFRKDISLALDGANITIFAYGQTGTGKTHTMVGAWLNNNEEKGKKVYDTRVQNIEQWGMIPRSLKCLFDQRESTTDSTLQPVLFMSYLQIYNDKIYDLLAAGGAGHGGSSGKPLSLRMNLNGQTHVDNLSKHELKSLDDALKLFKYGESRRNVRSTKSNLVSSRSHVILQLRILAINGQDDNNFSSLLTLVDLAGSEKWAKSLNSPKAYSRHARVSGAKRAHLKELNSINSSLSALGNCIRALSEKGRNHIPYRDSTLTKLLSHAFNPRNTGKKCTKMQN